MQAPGSSGATRPIELPAPGVSGTTPADTGRTEPGTWREIIARFERELGPVAETDATEEEASRTEASPAAGDSAGTQSTEPETAAGGEPIPAAEAEPTSAAETELTSAAAPTPSAEAEEEIPAAGAETEIPAAEAEEEEIAPGTPPSLDEAMPWEIAAMTTPDYTPPHSIHDREHDSWPVEAEDGDAVPAWSEDVSEDRAAPSIGDPLEEIGELLLDDEASTDPWDADARSRETGGPRSDFPLDAFIVPAGVHHAPTGYDADVARRVAHRLDELARQLRGGGLQSLGRTDSADELSRVLAAIVTGYIARDD